MVLEVEEEGMRDVEEELEVEGGLSRWCTDGVRNAVAEEGGMMWALVVVVLVVLAVMLVLL